MQSTSSLIAVVTGHSVVQVKAYFLHQPRSVMCRSVLRQWTWLRVHVLNQTSPPHSSQYTPSATASNASRHASYKGKVIFDTYLYRHLIEHVEKPCFELVKFWWFFPEVHVLISSKSLAGNIILAGGHVRASAGALAVHTALILTRVTRDWCIYASVADLSGSTAL